MNFREIFVWIHHKFGLLSKRRWGKGEPAFHGGWSPTTLYDMPMFYLVIKTIIIEIKLYILLFLPTSTCNLKHENCLFIFYRALNVRQMSPECLCLAESNGL